MKRNKKNKEREEDLFVHEKKFVNALAMSDKRVSKRFLLSWKKYVF